MSTVRMVELADGRARGEVRPGTALVFDRSWIGTEATQVAGIETEGEGAHGATLATLAASAVAAARGASIAVIGDGAVAAEAERILRTDGRAVAIDAPNSVIETTGAPDNIRRAFESVEPLGTVILAGEPSGRRYELDLYTDVHTRGLRVKGVPRPDGARAGGLDVPAGGQELRSGDALDPSALFYVLLPG